MPPAQRTDASDKGSHAGVALPARRRQAIRAVAPVALRPGAGIPSLMEARLHTSAHTRGDALRPAAAAGACKLSQRAARRDEFYLGAFSLHSAGSPAIVENSL